jgi:hypothetical protein
MRGDRPVSPSTLWRWYRHGVRALDGRVVKLRVWRVGGRTLTSEAALREFFAQLSATSDGTTTGEGPTAKDGRGDIDDQLDALGIG